jgi:MFS family permease
MRAFIDSWREPNLRRAQLSFGGAFASEWALTVGIGVLAYRQGGAAAVGVVGLARMLPAALLAPPVAIVVDRYRRERVLAVVSVVRGVALAAAAVAVLSSPLATYALAAVATLAHTLYRPAHSALLPSLCTTPSQLMSANVVRGLLDSLSALVGPLVAGLLIGPTGVSGVLAACAIASLWAAWLITRLDYEAPLRVGQPESARPRSPVESLKVLAGQPQAGLVSALFCVQTFTRGCFAVFSVVIALQLLHTGEAGVGVLTAAFGAGAVFGSFAGSLLLGSSHVARWFGSAIALWGAPFALLATVHGALPAFALLALVGIANALCDATGFTLLQRIVPDEIMGRYFAVLESLFMLTLAAGSIATSGLIALFGARGALVAVGLVAPAAVLLCWHWLQRLDLRLRVDDGIIAALQRVDMLRPLPLATIAELAARAIDERAPTGALVIQQGAAGDELYVICTGSAEVLVGDSIVAILGPGECFGEIAVLGRRQRTASVRAHSELELLRVTGEHLVRAVAGCTPSRTAADTLVEQRLASQS